MTLAIRVRGLVKTYPARPPVEAVRGLDLEVGVGECFGLLGPNGAGKTTTLEIIEGLLDATAGEVEVLGLKWGANDIEIRSKIGISLQETRLSDKLTVRETVTLFRSFYATGLTPDEAIARVSLEEKSNSYVDKLSGGQRQRLAVATALVGDPELLFLDEPTTGLDPQSRRQLWDVIRAIKERGRTVVVTTHYMDEAERCSHVGYIHLSKLVVCGLPDDLKQMPEVNPAGTRRLDVTCDHVTVGLQAMHRLAGVRSATVFGQSMHLLIDHGLTEARIRSELALVGILRADIRVIAPSLEDVFVALTTRGEKLKG